MEIGDRVIGLNEYVKLFKGEVFTINAVKEICGIQMISLEGKICWFNPRDFKKVNNGA